MEGLYYLTVAALCFVYPVETDVCIYTRVPTVKITSPHKI